MRTEDRIKALSQEIKELRDLDRLYESINIDGISFVVHDEKDWEGTEVPPVLTDKLRAIVVAWVTAEYIRRGITFPGQIA